MSHDAVIVGAGLSGLVCARRLVAAGLDVRVVEARPRVGGRLHSGQVGDAIVDLGGQWMSVDQPRLLALAGELGVASAAQPRAGRPIFDDSGRGAGLFARLATLVAQLRAVRRIDKLTRTIPPGDPAAAPGAAALDAIALGPWLAGTIGNRVARERIALHAELVFATDSASLSLLAYLARLGTTGGFSPRGPDLPGGGRDHRFVGGAQQLAERLAAPLAGALQLATPVTSVVPRGDRVAVCTADGELVARHVVLALPPALAEALAQPRAAALAASRSADLAVSPSAAPAASPAIAAAPAHAAISASPTVSRGSVVKCFAAYAHPFWRDAGLSGEAYCARGAIRAVVDGSPPGATSAVLQAFVVGPDAERWHLRDPDDRRREILASLSALFGPSAASPLAYLEADWAVDPWSAGCVASTPPGALTSPPSWRVAPRVHLAGTEAALRWPGYMEGAIEAGERAAAAVIATGTEAA